MARRELLKRLEPVGRPSELFCSPYDPYTDECCGVMPCCDHAQQWEFSVFSWFFFILRCAIVAQWLSASVVDDVSVGPPFADDFIVGPSGLERGRLRDTAVLEHDGAGLV